MLLPPAGESLPPIPAWASHIRSPKTGILSGKKLPKFQRKKGGFTFWGKDSRRHSCAELRVFSDKFLSWWRSNGGY